MLTFIGFSPAWQQVYQVDTFAPGDVLRAETAFSYASGKATNAAVVASVVGEEPVHLATVVGGAVGQVYEGDLFRHRLRLSLVRSCPTRVCTTIVPTDGRSTELIENVGAMTPAVAEEVHINVRRSRPTAIACSGSLPDGVPIEIYGKLVRLTEGPTIVDAASEPLLAALESEPTLVKPNRSELGKTLGITISPDASAEDPRLVDAMTDLLSRGAKTVLCTNGDRPATLLTEDGVETFEPIPIETLVNPIGAGDAMTGALLVALSRGESIADAVAHGLKAAAAKCASLRPEDVTL